MNKEEIKKIIKEKDIRIPDFKNADLQELESFFYEIGMFYSFNFEIELRSTISGSDYWLQVEFYSNTIDKTIIFDYDMRISYDNLDDFLNELERYYNEINSYEYR